MSLFRRALRTQSRIRLALVGPAGSGKTFTALRIATGLIEPGQRVAVIDTEHASSNLYADETNPDGGTFDFDVLDLAAMDGHGYRVEKYIRGLREAEIHGYPIVIIDSLSHAWAGEGGVLDYAADVTARSKSRNGFSEGWRKATPLHNQLVNAMLTYPGHVIVTLRSKVEWVVERVVRNGREQSVPRKVGLQPVQREGLDYEFTVVADLDAEHQFTVSKTRCSALADRSFVRPGADVANILRGWLAGADPLAPIDPASVVSPEQDHPTGWPTDRPHFTAKLRKHGLTVEQVRLARAAQGSENPDPANWSQASRDSLLRGLEEKPSQAFAWLGLEGPEPQSTHSATVAEA